MSKAFNAAFHRLDQRARPRPVGSRLVMARYNTFNAACSVGKWPRALTARRSRALRDSMALVLQTMRWMEGGVWKWGCSRIARPGLAPHGTAGGVHRVDVEWVAYMCLGAAPAVARQCFSAARRMSLPSCPRNWPAVASRVPTAVSVPK